MTAWILIHYFSLISNDYAYVRFVELFTHLKSSDQCLSDHILKVVLVLIFCVLGAAFPLNVHWCWSWGVRAYNATI